LPTRTSRSRPSPSAGGEFLGHARILPLADAQMIRSLAEIASSSCWWARYAHILRLTHCGPEVPRPAGRGCTRDRGGCSTGLRADYRRGRIEMAPVQTGWAIGYSSDCSVEVLIPSSCLTLPYQSPRWKILLTSSDAMSSCLFIFKRRFSPESST
jgi:hypothetical protein